MQIREPAVANQFYPGDAHMLKQTILRYLSLVEMPEKVKEEVGGESGSKDSSGGGKKIKGIIVPHAGYIYSGPTAAYGYHLLKNLSKDVEWKVVLIGVSHFTPFNGAAPFGEGIWKTPLGQVKTKDIRKELPSFEAKGEEDEVFLTVPEAHTQEHSLEVQVPFLQTVLSKFVLYPIAAGTVRPDYLADRLLEFVRGEDVIVVISSDLSHYLPYEEAKKRDKNTLDGILAGDIEKVVATGDACGITGILTMMFLAEKLGLKPVLLDYRNSGDTAGDKSAVVGYGAVGFMG